MGERDGVDPHEDEVAKRLNFATPGSETRERHRHTNAKSSSPSEAASVRDPLHGYNNGIYSRQRTRRRRRKGRTCGIGVLAALMVWMMCIACLGVMVWLNCDGCSELAMKDVRRFFSHAPLLERSQYSRNLILRRTKPLLDIFGALMCSMFIGLAFAAFTCLLMYYDSDDPGHFPPTPVSPRRDGEDDLPYSGWHLGYIFAPVNFIVGFSLALIYFRLSVGLPLYPQV